MKRAFYTVLILTMALALCGIFSACGDDSSSDQSSDQTTTEQGASVQQSTTESGGVVIVETPKEDFYGTWSADSGKAEHLYGNFSVTINEDGTWTGVITDEEMKGTWEETEFGVRIRDEEYDWECDLFRTDKGNFIVDEVDLEGEGKVVLTKH